MATVKKLQLKLNLSDGKTAIINLPEAKSGLTGNDLTGKFDPIVAAYATDGGATIVSMKVQTVETTTTTVVTNWADNQQQPIEGPEEQGPSD